MGMAIISLYNYKGSQIVFFYCYFSAMINPHLMKRFLSIFRKGWIFHRFS